MTTRQRSASALSHSNGGPSTASSPGGFASTAAAGGGGGGCGGPASSSSSSGTASGPAGDGGAHHRNDPDPLILSAAEIPSFDAMPIPSYGDGSPYPTMTATYIPSGMPIMTRPRAHTSADTSPSVAGGTAFGGLQPRTTASRNSMAPNMGMGVRHVSTSVLDGNARAAGMGGSGGGGGHGSGFGSPPGSSYGPGGSSSVPPPPPLPPAASSSSVFPAHALNQREYQPHYAPRPEYRSAAASAPNYHYSPQPPSLYTTPSHSATTLHQVPASAPAFPHPGTAVPYGQYTPPQPTPTSQYPSSLYSQEGSMYRHGSAQSTESLASSFSRVDNVADGEHTLTPATTHSSSSRGTNRNVPQSGGSYARPGPAQSPIAGPSGQLPVISEKDGQIWNPDRVQHYLQRHNFSNDWQQAFRSLNIYGVAFLELGINDNIYTVVLPHVLQTTPGLDEGKEMKAAESIKGMVSQVLSLSNIPPPGHAEETDGSANPKPPGYHKASGQRSSTLPSGYGENGNSQDTHRDAARGRNAFSKNALATVDPVRHSPSNSETSFQLPNNHAPNQRSSLSGSPHGSPNLGHQTISTRHGKSNSSESVASSMSYRVGDGKAEQKAFRILGIGGQKGETSHDRSSSRQESFDKFDKHNKGVVNKIRKRFWPKDGEAHDEESPTSPSWAKSSGLTNSPFGIAEHNGSSSSLDRASVSSVDGLRKPRSTRSLAGAAHGRTYVFVTRDGKFFVLIDITNAKTVEDLRKEICSGLGMSDWEGALICLTEVGQKDHDEHLTDQTLTSICRDRADSIASLKFFVRPSPRSAIDSTRSSMFMDKDISASPSKHADYLPDSRPMFSDRKPAPLETIESASATLRQSDYDQGKRSIGSSSDPTPSPTIDLSNNDEFGEIQRRVAHLRENYSQDPGGNPQINVIQPFSPNPPPPAAPALSMQPSHDASPVPEYAYPDWGYEHSPLRPSDTSASPIDGGVSPSGRENELFFDEDRSPATNLSALKVGHKGSAGTNRLEEAARLKLDNLTPQHIPVETRPVEQLPVERPREQPRPAPPSRRVDTGFEKIIPNRPPRVVDFDNPRPSPFEDKKGSLEQHLTPQRMPPPPPANRISSSYSVAIQRKKSVDKRSHPRPPEMLQKSRSGQGASPVGGIAGTLAQAGLMPSTLITRTPVPGTQPREITPSAVSATSATSSYTDLSYQQTPAESAYRPQNFASTPQGGNSPRSGQTPASPGFTWGKHLLFKIPDYVSEVASPQKLSLQIPPVENKHLHVSPTISPHERDEPSRLLRTPSFGNEIPFKENDVQFSTVPSGEATFAQGEGDDEDSDEDDGLFAIPISSRMDKSAAPLVENTLKKQAEQATGSGSPKPALQIATKSVKFKTTPSTSVTGSANSPPSPEYEEGDDRQGLNSPSIHSSSGPTSAAAHPHSPADYNVLGRRNSFREDVWASRPPAEALINHLDDFFPNVDLDQPIIDEVHISPPPSPSPITEKPKSYQLSDPPMPLPENQSTESGEAAPVGAMGPPPIPGKGKNVPAVVQRNVGRQQLGRMKSIREVMKGAHENRKRFTQPEAGAKSGDILRRKSTKLFGAKTIEIKPGEGKRGAMRQRQLEQMQSQQQEGQIKRQATFKWFKGQLIGKGTYGRVYLGMNATTGEFLAVKQVEVDAGGSEHQKDMITALNQEIETMQHLDHPNIVTYLGCERKEYGMSIFLEYISGGSVGSCLRKHGRFEEPVVRSLTRQTLHGLEYLHREGILHRDLKADNILLDVDGTCKISDFGISKKSDNIYGDDSGNSMQGSVFWMAPEVIRPEGKGYSAKIDIWSLGCVVLEMFAGRRPWSKEEAIGAIYKLGSERQAPPIPDDVSSVISPSAIGFLADCHTIEASERPTAATLLNAHEFCSLDPNFNFLDTELYHKIRGTFDK